MLRYPPTEIVLSPSDVEITMKRITARTKAKAAPYLSTRQLATANRTRLSRPPAEYDSFSDVSTQLGEQRDNTVSSRSSPDLEDHLAGLVIRDDRIAHHSQRVPGGEVSQSVPQ
jgi:hypothetical protein